MAHVINFHQAKSQRQREAVVRSFYDMFNYAIDFFVHYWFYPLVAAVETVRRRQLVVL